MNTLFTVVSHTNTLNVCRMYSVLQHSMEYCECRLWEGWGRILYYRGTFPSHVMNGSNHCVLLPLVLRHAPHWGALCSIHVMRVYPTLGLPCRPRGVPCCAALDVLFPSLFACASGSIQSAPSVLYFIDGVKVKCLAVWKPQVWLKSWNTTEIFFLHVLVLHNHWIFCQLSRQI